MTCCLCHSFLHNLFPCSSMGSHPQEIVLCELFQHGFSLRAAVLQKLLHHGSFPWSPVLQKQTAPVWVPHGVTRPARRPAPVWAPLPGVTPSFGHIYLVQHEVLHGLQLDICSTVDLHGLQGNLYSGTWCTSPSSFTDLGVCRVVSLTYSHSSLPAAVVQQFFLLHPPE